MDGFFELVGVVVLGRWGLGMQRWWGWRGREGRVGGER